MLLRVAGRSTLQLKSENLSDTEKQTYLKIAWDNAQRLTTLVEELFELAKLDANEVQPQREPFSLAELAFDLSHQFHLRARETGISFEVVADETVPQVSADVGMIERVLENLIDNSFKHTPAQGQIRLQLSNAQNRVDVSVRDTGCGISSEELPHILKRYYRKNDKRIDGSSESVSFDCESETINRSIHTYERVRKTLIELSVSNSIIESIE